MVTNIPGVVNQPTLIVSNFRIFLRNFTVFDNLEGNCKALKDRTTDETFINCLKANYKSELQKEEIERFELLLWLMKELRLVSRKTLELNRLNKASISTQWPSIDCHLTAILFKTSGFQFLKESWAYPYSFIYKYTNSKELTRTGKGSNLLVENAITHKNSKFRFELKLVCLL